MVKGQRIVTVGRLPPPVTGENLCRARLEEVLREMGYGVESVSRGLRVFTRGRSILILNGQSWLGTVFDMVLTCWGLLTKQKVYWYFHNISWQRFMKIPAFLWLGKAPDIQVIVLRKAMASRFVDAGYSATVLNNRVESVFDSVVSELPKPMPKRLIWMGRADEAKGFPLALEVLTRLREDDPDWHMDVYGAEIAYARARGYDVAGANYRGVIHGEEKVVAFCAGGIFILPSLYEVQPLSIIESMACGVPVIASDVGGVSEMLKSDAGDGGLSLISREPTAYVKAIMSIMPDYDRYSTNAQKIYQTRFSAAEFSKNVARIFTENGMEK